MTEQVQILQRLLECISRYLLSTLDSLKRVFSVFSRRKPSLGTPDVCKVVAGVAVGVHKLAPYKANFCKISRLCGAVSSFLINRSFSNQATLLVLRRFLQRCRRIFANWLFKRLKNPWKVCYHRVIPVNLFMTCL